MGELHFHVVVHLVAVCSVNENVEVEVLVAEGVGPSEGELGHGRPDIGLVVVVDNAIGLTLWAADVFEFKVANPRRGVAVETFSVGRIFRSLGRSFKVGQVFIHAIGNETIETVQRFAHVRHANHVVPLAVTHDGGVLCARKGHQFVFVPRYLELRIPLKSTCKWMCVHRKFQSRVAYCAVVSVGSGQNG